MADRVSEQERSRIMGKVKSKHTKPELVARSLLHRLGYRFTVNGPLNKKLPGRPDIVLPKYKTVIFVHGCFWHRHEDCRHATTPKSNQSYWLPKFERNQQRDRDNQAALRTLGWRPIVIWECELKDLLTVAATLLNALPRAQEPDLPMELEDAQLVAETNAIYRTSHDFGHS